jgi:hypothetical protein
VLVLSFILNTSNIFFVFLQILLALAKILIYFSMRHKRIILKITKFLPLKKVITQPNLSSRRKLPEDENKNILFKKIKFYNKKKKNCLF